jgi:hypothetical protein
MVAGTTLRRPKTSNSKGLSERLSASCTPEEFALAKQYSGFVDREISRLLRIMSLSELLAAARRLAAQHPEKLTAAARLRLVAEETALLADRMEGK